MPAEPATSDPLTQAIPLIGRGAETRQLRQALDSALAGRGSAWTLEGPGGIGKTRLLRWMESSARGEGFEVLWGYCLKETISPFFAFEQVFRPRATGVGATATSSGAVEGKSVVGRELPAVGNLPSVLILEEERPRRIFEMVRKYGPETPTLLLSRERPSTLRLKDPSLDPGTTILWLSRSEGEDVVPPSQMDALGERLQLHLVRHPGAIVAVSGLEYLVSQNAFLPVLRLLQFLRDTAESSGGHLLISLPSAAFEARELSLLEGEGEVLRPSTAPPVPPGAPESHPSERGGVSPGPEAPATTLLRYLDQLERTSSTRPALLIVDDLQWADAQSALTFQFLARNLGSLRVVLVAGLRDEATEGSGSGETSLSSSLESLRHQGHLRSLSLGGLAESEMMELIDRRLGGPLRLDAHDQEFRDFLQRSGGNPFFLLETVEQLRDEGWVRRQDGAFTLTSPGSAGGAAAEGPGTAQLPATIRKLVGHRIAHLPADLRRTLEVASVVGSEFEMAPLVSVLGRSQVEVEGQLKALHERYRLLETIPGTPRYAFGHPLVWEATRLTLPKEDLAKIAQQLAAWWATSRPEDVELIARLYHDARDGKEGIPWFRRAAEQAKRSLAADALLTYFRWWKELTGHTEGEVEALLTSLYEANWHIATSGAFREAIELAELAETLPVNEQQRWLVELGTADLLGQRDAARGAAILERLTREFEAAGPRVPLGLRSHLQVARGSQFLAQGRFEEAVGLLLPTLSAPPTSPELLRLQVRVMLQAPAALLGANRREEAREIFAQFRAERLDRRLEGEGLGARGALGGILSSEAQLLLLEGDVPGAIARFQEAIDHMRQTGILRWLTVALSFQAEALLERGDLAAARASLDEARALSDKFEFAQGAASERWGRGLLHLQSKAWDLARSAFEDALQRYALLGDPDAPEVRLGLARVRSETGDPTGALEDLRRLEPSVARMESRWRPQFYRFRSRVRGRLGDARGAREDLEKGLELARASGNRLAEGFLLGALGRWERTRGEGARADEFQHRAASLLRACGVERDPWVLV
ncbi:MAG: DUF835 domain-containing protein [Euryarchaeota archaeon]|nr:DUF835 domain-containing protein [Euryarchaeota archaeon]MDE1837121.1 DUF835 domain-containing protein [Euryarchaeota archaeon]MDE1879667.1 DUF835 domain-containing protein [Euryarchaeota archaeon]MDE2045193.1 DUF835 domain-containing protein [Thermoplasmata archaeon]